MAMFLAILTGGGLAALGGLLSDWIGARRDQRRYQHEQAMAREVRRQERLEQAYLELLTYLAHHWDWARSVRPMLGEIPAPDPVPAQERWRLQALVSAHGSPEVRRLLREWVECAAKIDSADAVIRMVEKSRNPSQQLDDEAQREHRALADYKRAMLQAEEAIRDQVHRELSGEA